MKTTAKNQPGLENSSQRDLFVQEMSTSAVSSMFEPMTSEATPNVTSSPESESGPMPCVSPAGKIPESAGPAPAPANPSARPAKARRSTTKGIYGQSSFDSSKHDDLSFALANKFRALTDSLGSTLFELTWMTRVTPAGFSIPALRASEPRTEGSVCIGWPTPDTGLNLTDANWEARREECRERHGNNGFGLTLAMSASLAGWPTTRAEDAESSGMRHSRGVASLTAWGTPAARDWKSGEASQETLDKNARPLSEQAVLTAWKTPCVPNGGRISGNQTDIGKHQDGTQAQIGLENEARLSGWTTPQAHDQTGRSKGQKEIHGTLHGCAFLVSEARLGAWPTPMAGTPAQKGYNEAGNTDSGRKTVEMCQWPVDPSTDSGAKPIGYLLGPNGWEIRPASGQLNAAHSRWLMALPAAWDDCGVTAMASLRKSRKPS